MIDSRKQLSWSAAWLMVGVMVTTAIAPLSFADDETPAASVEIKLTLVPSTAEKPDSKPLPSSKTEQVLPLPAENAKPSPDSGTASKEADGSVVGAGTATSQEAEQQSSDGGDKDDNPTPQNSLRSPSRLDDRPVRKLQLRGGTEQPTSDELLGAKQVQSKEMSPDSIRKILPSDRGTADERTGDIGTRDTRPADDNAECPGSPSEKVGSAPAAQQDDLPLVQEEHPYDAPPARPIDRATDRPIQVIRRADLPSDSPDAAVGQRIARVLHYQLTHPENLTRRGPWAVMHAALPFGVEAEVIAGNRRVNALGWMCYNGVCAKQRMFQPTKTGFRTNVGAGVQGHEGQFLAILAQSRVQPDYPILIGERRYTIMDLVKYEMATCREKSELTFKLIGLSHYLDAKQHWRDDRGRPWNLEKMVAEELAQPVVGAACGGTHRLMGLSFALVRRQQAGLPLNGHWHRAEVFIQDFVVYTMSLQNPDGSFSTEWFAGRGNAADVERKLQTTGHILEWLVYTLPDDELRSPRIRSAIDFLLNTLSSDLDRDWPIGPRGHALRALSLYYQRVYGGEPGQMQTVLSAAAKGASPLR